MTNVPIYTTAEEIYDGFGTQTIRKVGKTKRNQIVRMVETPPQHVEWQRARYASGLHLAIDQHQWEDLVACGLAEEIAEQDSPNTTNKETAT